MKRARFEVYANGEDGYRWRLIAGNGEIIAHGESYTRERDAWRAIRRIRYLAPLARQA